MWAIGGGSDLANDLPSVLSIIRSHGGIKGSGELRQFMGKSGTKGYIPGVINERRGISLDRLRELLIEAGHIHEDPLKPSSIGQQEVLDIIERDVRKKADKSIDPADEDDLVIAEAAAFHEAHGLHYFMTDKEEKRLIAHVRNGMSMDDAVELVAMETFREVEQEDAEFAEHRREHRGSEADHRKDEAGVTATGDPGNTARNTARTEATEEWIGQLSRALAAKPDDWVGRLVRAVGPHRDAWVGRIGKALREPRAN